MRLHQHRLRIARGIVEVNAKPLPPGTRAAITWQ
jgi:hypothetical protein